MEREHVSKLPALACSRCVHMYSPYTEVTQRQPTPFYRQPTPIHTASQRYGAATQRHFTPPPNAKSPPVSCPHAQPFPGTFCVHSRSQGHSVHTAVPRDAALHRHRGLFRLGIRLRHRAVPWSRSRSTPNAILLPTNTILPPTNAILPLPAPEPSPAAAEMHDQRDDMQVEWTGLIISLVPSPRPQ